MTTSCKLHLSYIHFLQTLTAATRKQLHVQGYFHKSLTWPRSSNWTRASAHLVYVIQSGNRKHIFVDHTWNRLCFWCICVVRPSVPGLQEVWLALLGHPRNTETTRKSYTASEIKADATGIFVGTSRPALGHGQSNSAGACVIGALPFRSNKAQGASNATLRQGGQIMSELPSLIGVRYAWNSVLALVDSRPCPQERSFEAACSAEASWDLACCGTAPTYCHTSSFPIKTVLCMSECTGDVCGQD